MIDDTHRDGRDEARDRVLDAAARDAAYDLKARYFFYVDSQQWERLRGLFTDDARFEGFAFGGEGPDAFVRGVDGLLTGARSVHQGSLPRFRAQPDSLVRARWSMQDYLTWPPGSRSFRGNSSPDLSGIRGYGYYDEEYRRTPEGWRIAFLRLTRLRIDLLHGPHTEDISGALPPDLDWLP
ncbi:nuclear transport factor 2 family protein [Streptomyces sp. NPDC001663]|uniref:nuclear transport factor 2 family protein n=1 Tax=Streptomyces sp. NPDC001663 TaxID=3364597 RepID=UPI0036754DE3